MKKSIYISLHQSGGIKQFSNYFIKKLKLEVYVFDRKLLLFFNFIKNTDKEFLIFDSNHWLIYLTIIFFPKKKIIIIMHDHKIRSPINLREAYIFYLYKLFKNKIEHVIAHSEEARKTIPSKSLTILEMPFHLPKLSKKIKLLFLGRMEGYKNVEFLNELFKDNDIKKYFHLIVAGSGKINKGLKQNLYKNESVSLINQWIDDELYDTLFQACDYLILPYKDLTETGLINVAGYYKKPLILSNIVGFKKHKNKEFAHFIDISSTNKSIDKMTEIANKSQDSYFKYAQNSFENYKASYNDWEAYKDELKLILQK